LTNVALRVSVSRPDQRLAEQVADTLRSAGLEVVGISARGVDAHGPPAALEALFGASVSTGSTPGFSSEPRFDRLPPGAEYRAYFPRKPEHFP
jgi:hypothetical protein